LVVGLIFSLICIGCSSILNRTGDKKNQNVETNVESKTQNSIPTAHHPEIVCFTHTVKYHGETLSIIASWYTKDIMNYPQLAEVNPGIDPERIEIGNKIRIPENLLKKTYPMPKEFVDSFYPLESAENEQIDEGFTIIAPE
jgi:AAA15 family ATPase/GTPase